MTPIFPIVFFSIKHFYVIQSYTYTGLYNVIKDYIYMYITKLLKQSSYTFWFFLYNINLSIQKHHVQ